MNFLFDSRSHQLWFPTTACVNCNSGVKRFDTSTSSTYRQTSNELSSIEDLTGLVKGYPCEEQVWFSSNLKIDSIPCLAVNYEKGF